MLLYKNISVVSELPMYQQYFQLPGDRSAIQDTELCCQYFTPYLKYAYTQVLRSPC